MSIDPEAISSVVAKEWCGVLEVPTVSREDEFFALGGDSLRAVELMSRVENRLGIAFPMEALFLEGEFGTVVDACARMLGPDSARGSGMGDAER
jgi:acyl carrier protein